MSGILLNRSRQVPAEETPAFGGIAERFRRAGDLDRAIALCRDGLKRFPDQLSARVTLGWAHLDKGQYDDARAELERVLRKAPDNLAAIRGLAELHDRGEAAMPSLEERESYEQIGRAIAEAKSAEAAEASDAPTREAVVTPAAALFASISVPFSVAAAFDPRGAGAQAVAPVEIEDLAAASMAAAVQFQMGVEPMVVEPAAAVEIETTAAPAFIVAAQPLVAAATSPQSTDNIELLADDAITLAPFDPGVSGDIELSSVLATLEAAAASAVAEFVGVPHGTVEHSVADDPVLELESQSFRGSAVDADADVAPLLESLGAEFTAVPAASTVDVVIEPESDEPAFELVSPEFSAAVDAHDEWRELDAVTQPDELTEDLFARMSIEDEPIASETVEASGRLGVVLEFQPATSAVHETESSFASLVESVPIGMSATEPDDCSDRAFVESEPVSVVAGPVLDGPPSEVPGAVEALVAAPVTVPVESDEEVTVTEPEQVAEVVMEAVAAAADAQVAASEEVALRGWHEPVDDDETARAEPIPADVGSTPAWAAEPAAAAMAIGSAVAAESLHAAVGSTVADVFGLDRETHHAPLRSVAGAADGPPAVGHATRAEVVSIRSRRHSAKSALPALERMLRQVEARRLQLRSETVA